jgi:non-heme chloroperoxidase
LSALSHLLCILALSCAIHAVASDPAMGTEVKQRIALKSGIRMAYQVAGPESNPPMVLLHGLGDTSRSWSLMLPELAKRNRIYIVDLRGHGETEAPACCYALADLGYDVITFMDAMKIDSAIIGGHSLGSFVGQHLATSYPSRVRGLILIGSADTTVDNEAVEWLWAQTLTFEKAPPPAFVDEWQSNPTPVNAEFIAKVKTETAEVPLHVWTSVARTLLTADSRRFIGEFKSPAMILWGEKDPMFQSASRERLRQLLPHAEFKVYPNLGHNPHWESPELVAGDIDAFVRSTAE